MDDLLPENFEELAGKEFKKYDYNGDGVIKKSEIVLLVRGLAKEIGYKIEEVNENVKKSLLLEIDTDGNKQVTFEEFKDFYAKLYLTRHSE
jgi:Ca2+-binding EF-hand superfamily protein